MRTGSPATPVYRVLHRVISVKLGQENDHTIANVVKDAGLVDTSTPDTDHVLVAFNHETEPPAVILRGNSREEHIGRDPVGT